MTVKTDDLYHEEENFCYIFANPDGYAVADGGERGGYLIRSVNRIFRNEQIVLINNFNDIVDSIRKDTKMLAGKGIIECVQDI